MSDLEDQIAKLIAEAERRAFKRGFYKAISVLRDALFEDFNTLIDSEPQGSNSAQPKPQRSGSGTMALVLEAITSQPGLKGVEVCRWLEGRGTPVPERTVRTNLRRLRQDRLVWQREKRWYPKNAKTTDEGEAADSNALF